MGNETSVAGKAVKDLVPLAKRTKGWKEIAHNFSEAVPMFVTIEELREHTREAGAKAKSGAAAAANAAAAEAAGKDESVDAAAARSEDFMYPDHDEAVVGRHYRHTPVPTKEKKVLEGVNRVLRDVLSAMASESARTADRFDDLVLVLGLMERIMTAKALYKLVDDKFVDSLTTALFCSVQSNHAVATIATLRAMRSCLERVPAPDEELDDAGSVDKHEASNREAFREASGVGALDDVLTHASTSTDLRIVLELLQVCVSLIGTRQHNTSYALLSQTLDMLHRHLALLWHWSTVHSGRTYGKDAERCERVRIAACSVLRCLILESDDDGAAALQTSSLETGSFASHLLLAIESAPNSNEIGARRLAADEFPRSVPPEWMNTALGQPQFLRSASEWGPTAVRARAASRDVIALLCAHNANSTAVLARALPAPLVAATLGRPAAADAAPLLARHTKEASTAQGLAAATSTDFVWWDMNRSAAKPKDKADRAAADKKVKRTWYGATTNVSKPPSSPREPKDNFRALWQHVLREHTSPHLLWNDEAVWELRHALWTQVEGLKRRRAVAAAMNVREAAAIQDDSDSDDGGIAGGAGEINTVTAALAVGVGSKSVVWPWAKFDMSYPALLRHVVVAGCYLTQLLPALEAETGAGAASAAARLRIDEEAVSNALWARVGFENDPLTKLRCIKAARLIAQRTSQGAAVGGGMGNAVYLIALINTDIRTLPLHARADAGVLWKLRWRDELLRFLDAALQHKENAMRFGELGGCEALLPLLVLRTTPGKIDAGVAAMYDDVAGTAADDDDDDGDDGDDGGDGEGSDAGSAAAASAGGHGRGHSHTASAADGLADVVEAVAAGPRVLSRAEVGHLAAHALLTAVKVCPHVGYLLCTRTNVQVMSLSLLQSDPSARPVVYEVIELLAHALPSVPLVVSLLEEHALFRALLVTSAYTDASGKGAKLTDAAASLLFAFHMAAFAASGNAVRDAEDADRHSSLARMLPDSMVALLRSSGPTKFAAVFNAEEHVSTAAIWNASMRNRLVNAIVTSLAPLIEWAAQETRGYMPPPLAESASSAAFVATSTYGAGAAAGAGADAAAAVPMLERSVSTIKAQRLRNIATVRGASPGGTCKPRFDAPGIACVPPVADVAYPELAEEPRVAGVFLRLYAANADVIVDTATFVPELSDALAGAVDEFASASVDLLGPDGVVAAGGAVDIPVDLAKDYRLAHLRCRLTLESLRRAVREQAGSGASPSALPPAVLAAVARLLNHDVMRAGADADSEDEGAGGAADAAAAAADDASTRRHDLVPAATLFLPAPGEPAAGKTAEAWARCRGWAHPTTLQEGEAVQALVSGNGSLHAAALRLLEECGGLSGGDAMAHTCADALAGLMLRLSASPHTRVSDGDADGAGAGAADAELPPLDADIGSAEPRASLVSFASMPEAQRRALWLSVPLLTTCLRVLHRTVSSDAGKAAVLRCHPLQSAALQCCRFDWSDLDGASGDGGFPSVTKCAVDTLDTVEAALLCAGVLVREEAVRRPVLDQGVAVFLLKTAVGGAQVEEEYDWDSLVDPEEVAKQAIAAARLQRAAEAAAAGMAGEAGHDSDDSDLGTTLQARSAGVRQLAAHALRVLTGAEDAEGSSAAECGANLVVKSVLRTLLTPGLLDALCAFEGHGKVFLRCALAGAPVQTPLIVWGPRMRARLAWTLAHEVAALQRPPLPGTDADGVWKCDRYLEPDAYRVLYPSLAPLLVVQDVYVNNYVKADDILAVKRPTPSAMLAGMLREASAIAGREPAVTGGTFVSAAAATNLELLIPAIATLLARLPKLECTAVGSDEERPRLGDGVYVLLERFARACAQRASGEGGDNGSDAGAGAGDDDDDDDAATPAQEHAIVHAALRVVADECTSRAGAAAAATEAHLHWLHMLLRGELLDGQGKGPLARTAPTGDGDGAAAAGGASPGGTHHRRVTSVVADPATRADATVLLLRTLGRIARNGPPEARAALVSNGSLLLLLHVAIGEEGKALSPYRIEAVKAVVAMCGGAEPAPEDPVDPTEVDVSVAAGAGGDGGGGGEALGSAGDDKAARAFWDDSAGSVAAAKIVKSTFWPLFDTDGAHSKDRLGEVLSRGFAAPLKVLEAWATDVAEPHLVWNGKTRADAQAAVAAEVARIGGDGGGGGGGDGGGGGVSIDGPIAYDAAPFLRRARPTLDKEILVGDVFVEQFNLKPFVPLGDIEEFVKRLFMFIESLTEDGIGEAEDSRPAQVCAAAWRAVANVCEGHPAVVLNDVMLRHVPLLLAVFADPVPRAVQAAALEVYTRLCPAEEAVERLLELRGPAVARLTSLFFYFSAAAEYDGDDEHKAAAGRAAAAALAEKEKPPLVKGVQALTDLARRNADFAASVCASGAVLLAVRRLAGEANNRTKEDVQMACAALLARLQGVEEVSKEVRNVVCMMVGAGVGAALQTKPGAVVRYFAEDHPGDGPGGEDWNQAARDRLCKFIDGQLDGLKAALAEAGAVGGVGESEAKGWDGVEELWDRAALQAEYGQDDEDEADAEAGAGAGDGGDDGGDDDDGKKTHPQIERKRSIEM